MSNIFILTVNQTMVSHSTAGRIFVDVGMFVYDDDEPFIYINFSVMAVVAVIVVIVDCI